MKKLFYFTIALFAGVVFAACSSIDCSIESKVACTYVIQDKAGNPVQLAYPLNITLMREAADSDTVIVNMKYNASSFELPMSFLSETDRIILSLAMVDTVLVDDTLESLVTTYLSDTISVTKTNHSTFESVDCAPRYNHIITGVGFTRNFIDTMIVNNALVNKHATTPNIFVRLRPADE